jgi:hypothetical protein
MGSFIYSLSFRILPTPELALPHGFSRLVILVSNQHAHYNNHSRNGSSSCPKDLLINVHVPDVVDVHSKITCDRRHGRKDDRHDRKH